MLGLLTKGRLIGRTSRKAACKLSECLSPADEPTTFKTLYSGAGGNRFSYIFVVLKTYLPLRGFVWLRLK
jgi:hypothetical protein